MSKGRRDFTGRRENAFVNASNLKLGDDFRLADGRSAELVDVEIEKAAGGDSVTTYNFEVADFHTYFVGVDGLWVHNSSGEACERVFSLFTRVKARNPELDDWKAFRQLLSLSDDTARRAVVDPNLGRTVDAVMHDVYSKAASGQTVNLASVPTHGEVVTDAMKGRLKIAGLQSHHAFPRYIQRILNIVDTTAQDSCPSLILDLSEHARFHQILTSKIPNNIAPGVFTEAELLAKLESAYSEFGKPEVWKVTKEWYIRVHIQ